jgi:hypothetical protein
LNESPNGIILKYGKNETILFTSEVRKIDCKSIGYFDISGSAVETAHKTGGKYRRRASAGYR